MPFMNLAIKYDFKVKVFLVNREFFGTHGNNRLEHVCRTVLKVVNMTGYFWIEYFFNCIIVIHVCLWCLLVLTCKSFIFQHCWKN